MQGSGQCRLRPRTGQSDEDAPTTTSRRRTKPPRIASRVVRPKSAGFGSSRLPCRSETTETHQNLPRLSLGDSKSPACACDRRLNWSLGLPSITVGISAKPPGEQRAGNLWVDAGTSRGQCAPTTGPRSWRRPRSPEVVSEGSQDLSSPGFTADRWSLQRSGILNVKRRRSHISTRVPSSTTRADGIRK
jgi:hypothetical protein